MKNSIGSIFLRESRTVSYFELWFS